MTDFIPLPEPYHSWLTARAWAYVTVGQVVSHEPSWRVFAHVPPRGWSFNYSMTNPGWRKLPEVAL